MYTQKEAEDIIKKQLALEYNCNTIDFESNNNIITLSRCVSGCRQYSEKWPTFKMITFGHNCIVSTTAKIKKRIEKLVVGAEPHILYEYKNLKKLEKKIRSNVPHINAHHMYMPKMEVKEITSNFEVKWYEQKELMQFKNDKRWKNALTLSPNVKDVLAVVAIIDGEIAGMAGCSEDTPRMWQIGIDVVAKFRGKGIGSTLVQMLKNEIVTRGKIPFYGISSANIHSAKIALKCGFVPTWIEI